jgi:hypothetical protein
MIKRAPRQPKHRTRLPNTFQPIVPSITWTASIVSGKVRVVASQTVVQSGIPAFTCQAVRPTSITSISGTTFDLGYAVTPVTTNSFVVDANDPAIRIANGGYLAPGTVTL